MAAATKAAWCRYTLDFTFEARTSRGSMTHKKTYFIRLEDAAGKVAYGEVPLFEGLSAEDTPDFESVLDRACATPETTLASPPNSSVAFGFESAFALLNEPRRHTAWTAGDEGIAINGLIWMGDKRLMAQRIAEKLNKGFRILKLKIGGINFEDELDLLKDVRRRFVAADLEIRLDANGSFTPDNALPRLERLAPLHIHSLEQPVRAGQPEVMAAICRKSPVAIALDEELIGCRSLVEKKELVESIAPQYLILKPALCGGFRAADEYIGIIGPGRWWATSALESNVGLAAIGAWVSEYRLTMPQGLGTGQLYSNNIASPLEMRGAALWYNPATPWQSMEDMKWNEPRNS